MKRPERAAWREPCERRERPPGRLGSVTDCLCGVEEDKGHEVHHVHHLNRTSGRAGRPHAGASECGSPERDQFKTQVCVRRCRAPALRLEALRPTPVAHRFLGVGLREQTITTFAVRGY